MKKDKLSFSEIVAKIKDRISIKEVAEKLDLLHGLTKTGNSLQGDCPTGHASQNHKCFSIVTSENYYHCFNCEAAGDILDLVVLARRTNNYDALRWLVENCTPDLMTDFQSLAANQSPAQSEANKHAILYNLIFEEGKRLLFDPVAKDVLDYLVLDRGYDPALLSKTEFIYWDTEANIRAFLLSKLPGMAQEISSLSLIGGFGDNFRLAIPYRNRRGEITGFLKRAHTKGGFTIHTHTGVRWDSTKGLEKADIFGLNRIKKGEDPLIVVEGYPDATYLPALGLPNIVACGQGVFSEKYLEGLHVRGIRRVVLALDNDGGTGIKNTEAACRLLADTDIQVFVLDPPAMGACKDPDEYVKANGIAAFTALVANAELGSTWMAKRMLTAAKSGTALEREKAIFDCLEYADSLGRVREAEGVLDALTQVLGLTEEVIAEEYKKLQDKKAAERLNDGVVDVARQAQKLIADGQPEQAIKVVQETTSTLQSEFWRSREPEKEKLDDYLVEKRKRDGQRLQGSRIGYELKDFSEIDKVISGLQSGLYIFAADPNIGKTAMMVSLMIDVLRSNPDVSCLFYSMDDSRDAIVNRMLAHLADMMINQVRFKLANPADEAALDTAYAQLNKWFKEGRIDIRESTAHLTMSRIQSEIQMHENRSKLVVFIDGLYNVPVDTDSGSLREENIDRANQVKQIVKLFAIPVIATAEFRKQGRDESNSGKKERTIQDIMESGKYGYNADLIVLLTPKDPDNYGSEAEPIIIADFGKNKLESFRGKMEFKFIRAKSVMAFVAGSTNNP